MKCAMCSVGAWIARAKKALGFRYYPRREGAWSRPPDGFEFGPPQNGPTEELIYTTAYELVGYVQERIDRLGYRDEEESREINWLIHEVLSAAIRLYLRRAREWAEAERIEAEWTRTQAERNLGAGI